MFEELLQRFLYSLCTRPVTVHISNMKVFCLYLSASHKPHCCLMQQSTLFFLQILMQDWYTVHILIDLPLVFQQVLIPVMHIVLWQIKTASAN